MQGALLPGLTKVAARKNSGVQKTDVGGAERGGGECPGEVETKLKTLFGLNEMSY